MAVVAPSRGVRYNPDEIAHLVEDIFTPPYDVISVEAGVELLEKNTCSMLNLDLRHFPQDDAGDDGRYQFLRSRFDGWQAEAVLIHDDRSAIYFYYNDCNHPSGKRMTSKGLVALVGLSEFSEGIVKPREKTFSCVISDRTELSEWCFGNH